MDSFLKSVGILALAFVIMYGYKKIVEYYKFKYIDLIENRKVYKAADAFAHGATSDDIRSLLAGCSDFNKGDVDEILMRSLPHRVDKDGGYIEFIKSVNKVLGMDVYSEKHQSKK